MFAISKPLHSGCRESQSPSALHIEEVKLGARRQLADAAPVSPGSPQELHSSTYSPMQPPEKTVPVDLPSCCLQIAGRTTDNSQYRVILATNQKAAFTPLSPDFGGNSAASGAPQQPDALCGMQPSTLCTVPCQELRVITHAAAAAGLHTLVVPVLPAPHPAPVAKLLPGYLSCPPAAQLVLLSCLSAATRLRAGAMTVAACPAGLPGTLALCCLLLPRPCWRAGRPAEQALILLPGPAPGAIGGLGGLLTQNSGGGLSLFSSDFSSNGTSNSTNATAPAPVATLNRTFAGGQTGVQVMHCHCLRASVR